MSLLVFLMVWSCIGRYLQSSSLPSSICVRWNSTDCPGGDRAITNLVVRLQYNYTGNSPLREGPTIVKNTSENGAVYELQYPNWNVRTGAGLVQFYFEQLEHGGGNCNCVTIYFHQTCTSVNRLEFKNRTIKISILKFCYFLNKLYHRSKIYRHIYNHILYVISVLV